jgi:hypothetical protein
VARGKRVPGIKVKGPLRENAQRIIAFRLQELLSWRHSILDDSAVEDLHNLRIAAKRLRYALEIFDICFPGVKSSTNQLTAIQEAVGDIHDLDVLIGIVRDRLKGVESTAEGLAVEIVRSTSNTREQSNQLRRVLIAQARNRQRLGLLGLLGSYSVQREQMYHEFQAKWGGEALDRFTKRLKEAIGLVDDAEGDTTIDAEDDGSEAVSPAASQSSDTSPEDSEPAQEAPTLETADSTE